MLDYLILLLLIYVNSNGATANPSLIFKASYVEAFKAGGAYRGGSSVRGSGDRGVGWSPGLDSVVECGSARLVGSSIRDVQLVEMASYHCFDVSAKPYKSEAVPTFL